MDNMNKNGICIYCCGSAGKVGWVSGWELEHAVGSSIINLTLSLWHRDAIIFHNNYTFNKVLQFIIDSNSAYGDYHIFNW